MAFRKKGGGAGKAFGVAAQKAFLAHLAQTSNVSASARAAGVTTWPVYALRGSSPAFCAKWAAALAQGYARLEANLLAEALSAPASNLKDSTLKQKQLKTRIAMALLAAHRPAARKAVTVPSGAGRASAKEVRARLEARFAAMHARLVADHRSGQ